MYLLRPPISPKSPAQLADKPSVKLHRGPGNVTTVVARDPDEVRHPVSQQWVKRYQNNQTTTESAPTKNSTETGEYTKGRK